MPGKLFVLEGLIGSGKSSLMKELALRARLERWKASLCWGEEPILQYASLLCPEPANPLLEFYQGSLPALGFQLHASHYLYSRDIRLRAALLDGSADTAIVERCLDSTRAFVKLLENNGRLSKLERTIALKQVDLLKTTANPFRPQEATLIYLAIEPSLALERVRLRARAGEDALTLDYLKQLETALRAQFNRFQAVH